MGQHLAEKTRIVGIFSTPRLGRAVGFDHEAGVGVFVVVAVGRGLAMLLSVDDITCDLVVYRRGIRTTTTIATRAIHLFDFVDTLNQIEVIDRVSSEAVGNGSRAVRIIGQRCLFYAIGMFGTLSPTRCIILPSGIADTATIDQSG